MILVKCEEYSANIVDFFQNMTKWVFLDDQTGRDGKEGEQCWGTGSLMLKIKVLSWMVVVNVWPVKMGTKD